MWSLGLAAKDKGIRREDEELARYARWEYGESDGRWLILQAKREAKDGSRRRFRRWFSSRLAARRRPESVRPEKAISDRGLRTANDGGVTLTEEIPALECVHDSLRSLGGGGNASYYRCQSCSQVVIAQGGTWWVLRFRDEGKARALE